MTETNITRKIYKFNSEMTKDVMESMPKIEKNK